MSKTNRVNVLLGLAAVGLVAFLVAAFLFAAVSKSKQRKHTATPIVDSLCSWQGAL